MVAAIVAGCARGDRYEVEYVNVLTRMEADAVVAIVRGVLEETARAEEAPDVAIDIVRVRAMPREGMSAAVPGIEAVGGNPPPSGGGVGGRGPRLVPQWEGPSPGASGPPFTTATRGWFVIDDASGGIIALEVDRG